MMYVIWLNRNGTLQNFTNTFCKLNRPPTLILIFSKYLQSYFYTLILVSNLLSRSEYNIFLLETPIFSGKNLGLLLKKFRHLQIVDYLTKVWKRKHLDSTHLKSFQKIFQVRVQMMENFWWVHPNNIFCKRFLHLFESKISDALIYLLNFSKLFDYFNQ
jgi:hypothetical protein